MPGHDLGLAIVVLTVIVRLIFMPLSIKAQRSQKALNAINPKVQQLREKYKNDQAAQGQALMELYREHKINPIAGCLPLLIQIPILLALYRAFIAGLNPQSLTMLYHFVPNPGVINSTFLGFLNIIGKNPAMALLAGILQFLQARQSLSFMKTAGANPQMAALNSQMLYIFPLMIVIIGWNLPVGLILYWITTTVFSIGEQFYLRKTS